MQRTSPTTPRRRLPPSRSEAGIARSSFRRAEGPEGAEGSAARPRPNFERRARPASPLPLKVRIVRIAPGRFAPRGSGRPDGGASRRRIRASHQAASSPEAVSAKTGRPGPQAEASGVTGQPAIARPARRRRRASRFRRRRPPFRQGRPLAGAGERHPDPSRREGPRRPPASARSAFRSNRPSGRAALPVPQAALPVARPVPVATTSSEIGLFRRPAGDRPAGGPAPPRRAIPPTRATVPSSGRILPQVIVRARRGPRGGSAVISAVVSARSAHSRPDPMPVRPSGPADRKAANARARPFRAGGQRPRPARWIQQARCPARLFRQTRAPALASRGFSKPSGDRPAAGGDRPERPRSPRPPSVLAASSSSGGPRPSFRPAQTRRFPKTGRSRQVFWQTTSRGRRHGKPRPAGAGKHRTSTMHHTLRLAPPAVTKADSEQSRSSGAIQARQAPAPAASAATPERTPRGKSREAKPGGPASKKTAPSAAKES